MKVKSNATYVFKCQGVVILPGINFVNSEMFFKHPSVKRRIESGLLEILDSNENELEEKEIALMELNSKILIKEINMIYDLGVLNKILEKDERTTVKKACEKQIARIKESEEEKEEA